MGSPISRKARALRVRKRREKKGILAEGVSLEVVHAHRDEIKLRIGVVVEEAEGHDADARFEGEEIGLVVRASFREDRDALLLGQGIPHRSEHLMIVDMREELERERVDRWGTSALEEDAVDSEEGSDAGFDFARFRSRSVSLSTSFTT